MTVTPTLRMVYHMTRFTIEFFLSPELIQRSKPSLKCKNMSYSNNFRCDERILCSFGTTIFDLVSDPEFAENDEGAKIWNAPNWSSEP